MLQKPDKGAEGQALENERGGGRSRWLISGSRRAVHQRVVVPRRRAACRALLIWRAPG